MASQPVRVNRFALRLGLTLCFCLAATRAGAQIRINEVDSDTQGTDVQEFVELYDGGVGNQSLTGRVLVFYDGATDQSYFALDLDGFTTNAQGYFLVGNPGVIPAPNSVFPDNTLQNGTDAVALYQANGSNFPNGTAITTANILDALVYKANTADPDDAELQVLLNVGQPQVAEGGSGNATLVSMHRCPNGSGGLRNTSSYALTNATPGAAPSCPPTTGACCTGGSNCQVLTPAACAGISGAVFAGLGTTCTPGLCPISFPGVKINELRIDQTGTDADEYLEIVGAPGTSLNGLTYIVIGDTGVPPTAGIIEHITNLAGQVIPSDGHWLGAGAAGTLIIAPAPGGAVPDFVFPVNTNIFENSDTVTHMLVAGFSGTLGQDLDTLPGPGGDDCTLDATPWTSVIDRVSLVNCTQPQNPCPSEVCHYAANSNEIVGPDTTFHPGHVYRLPDATGPWQIGPFGISDAGGQVTSVDTPGKTNTNQGACCQGGICTVVSRDECILNLGGVFKGAGSTCSSNICTGACCNGVNCNVTDPVSCAGSGGVFQGAGTTCPPNPACGACITITQARALPAGTRVKLCNVIVSSTTDLIQSGTVKSFQIEDTSGTGGRSGLTVFGNNSQVDAIINTASEGTQISIQGVTSNFNGLLELIDGSLPLAAISIGGNVGNLPVATVIATDFQDQSPTAEGFESEVVVLRCVRFLAANGSDVFLGGTASSNYLVTDGLNTATVRIASNTLDFEGQVIPSGPVTITGVFSQSDLSTPFDSTYQLLPRRAPDIDTGASCTCTTGDINMDGSVNGRDIRRFCELLAGFPGTSLEVCAADCEDPHDCVVDFGDMSPFVSILLQSSGSSASPIMCCIPKVCIDNVDSFATLTVPGTSEETAIQFGTSDMPAIPANFFYNGSNAVTGRVVMAGIPVNEIDLGRTDTRVQRSGPVDFPGVNFPRPSTPVPVEIIELTLTSIQPITVTGTSPPQDWIIAMNLAPTQNQGILNATLDSPQGGTFTATVPVRPYLIFVRKADCLSAVNGGPFNPNVAIQRMNWDENMNPAVLMSLSSPMQFSTVPPTGGEFYCPGELNNPFPFFPGTAPGGGGGGGGGGGTGDGLNSARFGGPACPPHVPPGTMNNHYTCPPPPPPPGRCSYRLARVIPIAPCPGCGLCVPPTLKISLQCPAATGTNPPCAPNVVAQCPEVIVVMFRCPSNPDSYCVAIYGAAGCCSG